MSAASLSAGISVGCLISVCKTIEAFDMDGHVTLRRHEGGDLVLTGEEAKKVILAVLTQISQEIAATIDDGDGDA